MTLGARCFEARCRDDELPFCRRASQCRLLRGFDTTYALSGYQGLMPLANAMPPLRGSGASRTFDNSESRERCDFKRACIAHS